MKKIFLVLSIMLISTSIYAIEVSVGFSAPGIGLGILRGDGVLNAANLATERSGSSEGMEQKLTISFAPAFQTGIMIEVLPFLALETGIGYTMSTVMYENEYITTVNGATVDASAQLLFTKTEITIPFMFRLQHEFRRFVMYGAVGVKLGIPVSKGYLSEQTLIDGVLNVYFPEDASSVSMDISFSLGGEFRIASSHYLGLRLGYDLNVISPFDAEKYADARNQALNATYKINASDYKDIYHDSFGASVTYRYAFGSKWNK